MGLAHHAPPNPNVSINLESKARQTNREVLNELINLHLKTSLGGKLPAYDGRKSLYTAGSNEFVVTLLDQKKKEKECYITVPRSFFFTSFGHRGDIGDGLECWKGQYQSLCPPRMRLSLNIDIFATIFLKLMEELLNIRDTSRPLSDRERVKIKKALHGVHIETSHQQDQIRRYKITGITSIPMSQLIFPVDEMRTRKTVVQYFWDKYDYGLRFAFWPCLQAGSYSRAVYLPMERYPKKLNDKQVTNIPRATCKRPQEQQSIGDIVLHKKYAKERYGQEYGIQICNNLVSVPARLLPPPLLKYHESGREKVCASSVGQWNMINQKMISGGIVDNWTCLNFSRMRPEEVQRFCLDLIHTCNASGMSVNPHPFIDVKSAAPNHIENALRDVHRRASQMHAKQGIGNQLQLLIVILPDVSDCYGTIKRVCEAETRVISQYCLPKYASRPNKKFLETVALEINLQVEWHNNLILERAFLHNGFLFVSEVSTITLGDDVTPAPPVEKSSLSFDAWMSSMDMLKITQDCGLVLAQQHKQTIIDLFSVMIWYPQKGHTLNDVMIWELLMASGKANQRAQREESNNDKSSEGCETDFIKKGAPHAGKITVFVQMLGKVVPISIDKMASLEYIVDKAMKKLDVKLRDVYYTCNGRIVPQGSMIDCSCILLTRHRLRGGARNSPCQLKDIFQQLMIANRWLEKVQIPTALMRQNMAAYIVGLAEDAQYILWKLFGSLEKTHEDGFSYDGSFTIDDIWYIPDFDEIEIRGENLVPITQAACISDFRGIKNEVINKVYRYKESDHSLHYPIYLADLVRRIDSLQPTGVEYRSKKARAMFFLHPGTKSAWQRIKMVDALMICYHKMSPSEEKSFRTALGEGEQTLFTWDGFVSDPLAAPEMVKNYNHKNYDSKKKVSRKKTYAQNYFGWLDFVRCLVTHVQKKISAKEVDAAVFVIWNITLPVVQERIINSIHPASGSNVLGSAGSSGGAVIGGSSAVSNAATRIRWGGATLAAGSSSSSSTSNLTGTFAGISINQISVNKDPEIHQILGFCLKPCN